jgi:hypothetical protein
MTFQEKKDAIINCGLEAFDLDILVQDVASRIASNINNSGIDAQLTYLFSLGMSVEEILEDA